jgi:endonuclease/exonuclease/phosphatase family metal-dependent hydrolase
MTPAQSSLGTSPTRLKVVTFNTWKCDGDYALRVEAMGQQMQALEADVFALQECFSTLDGSTDTARSLADSLGMHLHTAPARRKRRRFQGEWVDSCSSLAVLSRWPIRSDDTLELPSSVADEGRSAQFCSLEVAGRSVLLVNAHLSHLPQSEGGGALRAEQLRTLLGRAVWMPRHDMALVCGDFNASMDASELAPFLAPPWSLVDAYVQAGACPKVTYHTPEGQGLNLDHILCVPSCSRARVGCLEASVVLNAPAQPSGVWPSDHAGVSVTFGLG